MKVDPSIDYRPGYLCPSCRNINNRLVYRETEAGNSQAYCRNCGFWDWLTDKEEAFWKRVKGEEAYKQYFV